MKLAWLALVGVICVGGLQQIARAGPIYYDPFASYDFDVTLGNENTPVDGLSLNTGPDWLIVGVEATDATTGLTNEEGYWEEYQVPVEPGFEIQITSLDTSDPVTLSNAGFFLSTTEIPLDSLNFNDYPPPGPGSPLVAVPGLDGPLLPGDTLTADVTGPEPTSLGLLGMAGLAILARRRSRGSQLAS